MGGQSEAGQTAASCRVGPMEDKKMRSRLLVHWSGIVVGCLIPGVETDFHGALGHLCWVWHLLETVHGEVAPTAFLARALHPGTA